jgi:APA family basic amino acid/polyamine antiporter
LVDAANITIGVVIGSAIFLVPGEIARSLSTPGLILGVWFATGVLSFFGALAYAELGAMLPATGGQYVYLREAYGPLWAFLCGWSFFLVVESGGTASLAAGFAIYLGYFVPMNQWQSRVAAAAIIGLFTWFNYRGIREGALVQNILTFLKLGGLAVLIGSAFVAPAHVATNAPGPAFSFSSFGVAMIACLWAYEGWNSVSLVAGEVADPQRNIPRSLVAGMALVVGLYMLANVAYLRLFPVAQIAASERIGGDAAEKTLGRAGSLVFAVTILVSIGGALNGSLMTIPRIYFTQARDGLFFKRFGDVHPRYRTPHVAILMNAAWSALLALSGSYETLYSYAVFSAWIFYGLTVMAVPILRRKAPDAPRPYRMHGYPVTPLIFAAVAGWFVLNTLATSTVPSLIGLGILAAGVPVYYMMWDRP